LFGSRWNVQTGNEVQSPRAAAVRPLRSGRYSPRAVHRSILLVLAFALLATGCGSEPSAYKAEPTAKCLREDGYRVTTDPAQLGVVEKNADNGGLIAYEPGNAVRIAFAKNSDDALGVERGFRRFVRKKVRRHIADVMRTQKNAVLLWTITPPQDELNNVYGCLKG
jgi:hypothetical protein